MLFFSYSVLHDIAPAKSNQYSSSTQPLSGLSLWSATLFSKLKVPNGIWVNSRKNRQIITSSPPMDRTTDFCNIILFLGGLSLWSTYPVFLQFPSFRAWAYDLPNSLLNKAWQIISSNVFGHWEVRAYDLPMVLAPRQTFIIGFFVFCFGRMRWYEAWRPQHHLTLPFLVFCFFGRVHFWKVSGWTPPSQTPKQNILQVFLRVLMEGVVPERRQPETENKEKGKQDNTKN